MNRDRKRRILVIDDDPTICEMLSDVLNDEGYEVRTTTQSLRAFDVATKFKPNLILLDIMMPYLDGIDHMKIFSLGDRLKRVSVIVITAKASALDGIENPKDLGIVDILYKPFEILVLLEKIANAPDTVERKVIKNPTPLNTKPPEFQGTTRQMFEELLDRLKFSGTKASDIPLFDQLKQRLQKDISKLEDLTRATQTISPQKVDAFLRKELQRRLNEQ